MFAIKLSGDNWILFFFLYLSQFSTNLKIILNVFVVFLVISNKINSAVTQYKMVVCFPQAVRHTIL